MKEAKGGDKGNGGEDNTEETKTKWSFVVSFSFVKESTESWYPPLLSLGDDMTEPDRRGEYVGVEGEEWRGQREP